MAKESGISKALISLDQSKAFDRVDHLYLEEVRKVASWFRVCIQGLDCGNEQQHLFSSQIEQSPLRVIQHHVFSLARLPPLVSCMY